MHAAVAEMPQVDRGGGREGKGHDRRSLKRLATGKANPFDKKDEADAAPQVSAQAPRLPPRSRADALIDCGANLVSRQLARDQARTLTRAAESGVDAVLCFVTDFDRVGELQTLVKAHPSFLYAVYGMHPDNVKRSADKIAASKLAELRALALAPECVGILVGLDLSRDVASHYAQERLLESQLELAASLRLPVVLHEVDAGETAAEKLVEFAAAWRASELERERSVAAVAAEDAKAAAIASAAGGGDGVAPPPGPSTVAAMQLLPRWDPRVAVFAFSGSDRVLDAYLAAGCWIVITGLIVEQTDASAALRASLRRIPLARLLLASNSPHHTPACIPDHFVRTSRNEPSNLPAMLPALAEAWNAGLGEEGAVSLSYAEWLADGRPEGEASRPRLTAEELAGITYDNAAAFFSLPLSQTGTGTATSAASTGATATAPTVAVSAAAAHVVEITPSGGGGGAASSGSGPGDAGIDSTAAEAGVASSSALKLSSDPTSQPAPVVAPTAVHYLCRVCRTALFTGDDVQPHDGSGIRPSAHSMTAASAAAAAAAPATAAAVTAVGAAAASSTHAAGGGGGDVAASRWHTAGRSAVVKRDVAGCRMWLVDRQPWMSSAVDAAAAAAAAAVTAKSAAARARDAPTAGGGSSSASSAQAAKPAAVVSSEGSLLCPGCGSKVSQRAWWLHWAGRGSGGHTPRNGTYSVRTRLTRPTEKRHLCRWASSI